MEYLAYLLRQTGRNIRQTWGTQVMTLLTVTLSVLIFSFFFLVYTNLLKASERFGDELRLVVYLDKEIEPQQQPQVEKKIRSFSEVEKVTFLSRADAFARLQAQLGEEQDVLADLGPDFLPPSIEVYPAKTLRGLTQINQFSEYLQALPGVAKVQYGREWLERFGSFTKLIRVIVFLSGGLLIISMTFIVSYTIRLTVVSRHSEMEILRLLGATSAYLRLPLLLEGVLQGFCGSALGLSSLFLLYRWICDHFAAPGVLRLFEFTFFSPEAIALILLSSILLCSCGSLVSIRRFMRI